MQLAASSAALHFSGSASTKHAVIEKVGLTVSDSAKMEARRRDSERVKEGIEESATSAQEIQSC